MKSEAISLKDYWDLLNRHDWYSCFSDDGRVVDAGERESNRMLRMASQSPEHQALYKAFRDYHFTGRPWNTEQTPKPERPQD